MQDSCEFYCVSYNSLERAKTMTDRFRQLIAQWAVAEVAPGRLLPWLPVVFGFGIVLYFTADREPAWWAAASAVLAASVDGPAQATLELPPLSK